MKTCQLIDNISVKSMCKYEKLSSPQREWEILGISLYVEAKQREAI